MPDNEPLDLMQCPYCAGLGKRPRVKPLDDAELEKLKDAVRLGTFRKLFDVGDFPVVMRSIAARDFEAWRELKIETRMAKRKSLGIDAVQYRPDEIEELISQVMTKDFIVRHVVEWGGKALAKEDLLAELDNVSQAQLDQVVAFCNATDDEFKDLLFRAAHSDQIKK